MNLKHIKFFGINLLSSIMLFFSSNASASGHFYANLHLDFYDHYSISTPNSTTIFNPVINISQDVKIGFIGFKGDLSLKASGQCGFIGAVRFCARFTAPCMYGNTSGGGCASGSPSPGPGGCPGCADAPAFRICVYEDPMFPADPTDLNPYSEPFQKNTNINNSIGSIGDKMIQAENFLLAQEPILGGLAYIYMMEYGELLKLIGSIASVLNQTVKQNIGCIDVPLGPFPPAFFSPMVGSITSPSATAICANYPSSKQVPTSSSLCEVSGTSAAPVYSSFEQPLMRIFFNNPIPLCQPGYKSTADICVVPQNITSPDSLFSTNYSLLPICASNTQTNCINFPSGLQNAGPFRTYYNTSNAPNKATFPYFAPDPLSGVSLTLAGINNANYVDVPVGNSSVSLTDTNSVNRTVGAAFDATGSQICAYDNSFPGSSLEIICAPRPTLPLANITVSPAATSMSSIPLMSVSLGAIAPKTAILGVDLTTANPNMDSNGNPYGSITLPFCKQDDLVTSGGTASANPAPCTIYSAQFSPYLTDNYNQTIMYSGDAAGNIPPNLGTKTLSGLSSNDGIKYIKGGYCSGATKICLSGYVDNSQQVVAKYITNSAGTLVVSDDIRDRVIPPYPYKNSVTGGFEQYPIAPADTYESSTNLISLADTSQAYIYRGPSYTYTDPNTGVNGQIIQGQAYPVLDNQGQAQYGTRNLNAIEYGLCTPIPLQACPVTNDNRAYLQWNGTTPSNTYSLGSCAPGYYVNNTCASGCGYDPSNSLVAAYCAANPNAACPPVRKCALGTQPTACASAPAVWQQDSGGNPVVTNPCVHAPIPNWWPSMFLTNQNFQGAIFNHFNVNYSYASKFIPSYNNFPQSGAGPQGWITTGYNNCGDYSADSYTPNLTLRNAKDGDQEMLFLTSSQWMQLWSANDLSWLSATATNIPAGATYSNYDGCYVYDVTNNISAKLSGITVGMKICKAGDKISFSLVDTTANNAKDYTNTAYIMQSNLIDYYANDQGPTISLANNTGGNYINHGIVITRAGFAGDNITPGNLPNNFNSISTPESIDIAYSFKSDSYGYQYNSSRSKNHYHAYSSTNSSISAGCALSVYRGGINYPYEVRGNVAAVVSQEVKTAYSSDSNGYYIPLTSSNYSSSANLSIFDLNGDIDHFEEVNCTLGANISNYKAGNSAANPSMFLWSSANSYNACNY